MRLEKHETFKSSGRQAETQSGTGNGKAERTGVDAGSPNQQAIGRKTGNVAEAVGTKKTNIMCG
ncbi:hypothetical protein GCM10022269_07030 [Sphingorhabdus rigui]